MFIESGKSKQTSFQAQGTTHSITVCRHTFGDFPRYQLLSDGSRRGSNYSVGFVMEGLDTAGEWVRLGNGIGPIPARGVTDAELVALQFGIVCFAQHLLELNLAAPAYLCAPSCTDLQEAFFQV